jgi:hypothetical protein
MQKEKLALALPGIMGGILSVLLGAIAFLYNYPSLGSPPEGAIAISPAAGGLLYVLMGISALLALTIGSSRSARISSALTALTASAALVASLLFQEWTAGFLMILIAAAAFTSSIRESGGALLLAVGLLGFLVGQASMTFLICGWKTWTVPGLLMIYSAIMPILASYGPGRYPPHEQSSASLAVYSGLGIAVLLLAMVFLVRAPDDAVGSGINLAEGRLAERLGFYEAASRAYQLALDVNRSDSRAWEGEGRALQALGSDAQARERLDRAAELGAGPAAGSCSSCPSIVELNESIVPNKSTEPPGNIEPNECKELDMSQCSFQAKILLPGDVRTYSQGESIGFQGSASCGREPVRYLWRSSIDGDIGEGPSFSRSDLSTGWHNITLLTADAAGASVEDHVEIGVAEHRVCGNAAPRPSYFPPDTPCQDSWPNGSADCMEHEVCHAGLDYIVADAVNCCDGTPIQGEACAFAAANSEGSKKRCRGLYIIKALGTEARYMRGYALFKACCSGYPECTRACLADLAGTCAFREGFNGNVSNLSCRPEDWGLEGWRSDTNMSDEAITTASSGYNLPLLGDHPGHAYNIVKLPGEDRYYFVDTTGNAEGINLQGLPDYFWFTGCFAGMPVRIKVHQWSVEYCNKTLDWGYSDAGVSNVPSRTGMMGC